jgi:hypothetical protein
MLPDDPKPSAGPSPDGKSTKPDLVFSRPPVGPDEEALDRHADELYRAVMGTDAKPDDDDGLHSR